MLKLDLQFFGEDDVDIEAELASFEAEWNDDPAEETVETVETAEETPETTEEVEVPETQETPEAPPVEDDKRNKAFAELRRQAEENKRYAEFISRMAQDNGVKPEDILARYEERKLQEQAQAEGVPVDFLKRQTSTESEVASLKEQLAAERLDKQIQSVVSKYSATDADIQTAFEEMFKSGIDPRENPNVDFERFYRAANLDSIIQKEVERSRQKDLEDKAKRQESASVPNGASVTQTNGELSDDEFESMLAKMDIRI